MFSSPWFSPSFANFCPNSGDEWRQSISQSIWLGHSRRNLNQSLQVTRSFLRQHPGQSPGRSPTQAWHGAVWDDDILMVMEDVIIWIIYFHSPIKWYFFKIPRFHELVTLVLFPVFEHLEPSSFGLFAGLLMKGQFMFPIFSDVRNHLDSGKMARNLPQKTAQELKLWGPQGAFGDWNSWCEPAAICTEAPIVVVASKGCIDGWNPFSKRFLGGNQWTSSIHGGCSLTTFDCRRVSQIIFEIYLSISNHIESESLSSSTLILSSL